MAKKATLICLMAVTACLVSCKENAPKNKILGRWRSVRIENRDKDEFFRSSLQFIDTMGNNSSDAENMEIYGVTNMDSLRKELRLQYDSAYAAQQSIDTQSSFSFREDGTVIFGFPGKNEQGKWAMNENGTLQLEETNDEGQTEKVDVTIAELSDEKLQLVFTRDLGNGEGMDTSIVTFRREKN